MACDNMLWQLQFERAQHIWKVACNVGAEPLPSGALFFSLPFPAGILTVVLSCMLNHWLSSCLLQQELVCRAGSKKH
jgi:hypothetical protein